MSKACKKCGDTKDVTEFHEAKTNADRLSYVCKACVATALKIKHNLNRGFASLQPKSCECCGTSVRSLGVDHDHKTGLFRGFICQSCNVTIGLSGDTYEGLLASDKDVMYLDYLAVAAWRQGTTVFIKGRSTHARI